MRGFVPVKEKICVDRASRKAFFVASVAPDPLYELAPTQNPLFDSHIPTLLMNARRTSLTRPPLLVYAE